MEKQSVMVVITSDDEVKTMPYEDYRSQQKAVEGSIEHFGSSTISIPFGGNLKVDFWCNEEFRYSEAESCKKVNPLGSALYSGILDKGEATFTEQGLIFGNVAITVALPEGETRGFENIIDDEGEQDICETWFVEDILLRIKNGLEREGISQSLHEGYDNKTVEPEVQVMSFDDPEEFLNAMQSMGKADVKTDKNVSQKKSGTEHND